VIDVVTQLGRIAAWMASTTPAGCRASGPVEHVTAEPVFGEDWERAALRAAVAARTGQRILGPPLGEQDLVPDVYLGPDAGV
jgi:hypothetical protein